MVKVSKFHNIPASRVSTFDSVIIRFLIKKAGKHDTLYVRVTVNGRRGPDRSTGFKVNKQNWDPNTQEISSKDADSQYINTQLSKIKIMIYDARHELERKGESITGRKLLELVFDHESVLYTIQTTYEIMKAELGVQKKLSKASIQTYDRYIRNVLKFFSSKGRKAPLLEEITKDDFMRYLKWLNERYKQDYAVKNAQYLRTLFNYALSNSFIDHNPLTCIRLEKSGHYDTTHLTQEQIRKIAAFDFTSLPLPESTIQKMEQERDVLVFTCYTGQHHADYSKGHYTIEKFNGRSWLTGHRVKSKGGRKDKTYSFPLHPLALLVIEKYGGIDLLPKRANPERNLVLKNIAAYVGLEINLTTKTARKSFADYCLNVEGMREEVVAAVLGHKTTKFLKHYTKISNLSIDREMTFKDLVPNRS